MRVAEKVASDAEALDPGLKLPREAGLVAVTVGEVVLDADGEEDALGEDHAEHSEPRDPQPGVRHPQVLTAERKGEQDRDDEHLVRQGVEHLSEGLVIPETEFGPFSSQNSVEEVTPPADDVEPEAEAAVPRHDGPDDEWGQEHPKPRDPVGMHVRRHDLGQSSEEGQGQELVQRDQRTGREKVFHCEISR